MHRADQPRDNILLLRLICGVQPSSLTKVKLRHAHGSEGLEEEIGGEGAPADLVSKAGIGLLHPDLSQLCPQAVIVDASPHHLRPQYPLRFAVLHMLLKSHL